MSKESCKPAYDDIANSHILPKKFLKQVFHETICIIILDIIIYTKKSVITSTNSHISSSFPRINTGTLNRKDN